MIRHKPVGNKGLSQKELVACEEKFRLLFEKSPDPILLLHGDVFVDCNEATLRCLRCSSKDQLIGMRPQDLSPERQPDGRLSSDRVYAITRTTLKTGSSRFEWVHRTLDGEELWMDVSLTLIPAGGRQIMYTRWTDITRRKKAEAALLDSQLHLSEAMDLARVVHWELDVETNTFIFNDPFYNLYGTTAKREGGYRMARDEYARRFLPPDEVSLFRKAAEERALYKGREFFNEFEHRIIRRDGEVRYVMARIRAIKDARGRITRCYGANQDITERKQTAKALIESEERYRTAIESSNDGVAIVRGDQHAYVNQRFLTMFGYSHPADILGLPLRITVHPSDWERIMEINRSRQRGEPVPATYEFNGVRRDGTSFRVEVSAARIVHQGQPATLAYLRDVTELRRVQEQLRQAQKLQAVGTLAGGIAHDFNNMLAVIIGNAELALDDIDATTGAAWNIEQVLEASRRARDLVKHILAFSRKTESGRNVIRLTPLVKETFNLLRGTLPSTIRIDLAVETEEDAVLADPSQIQQILMNLAMNAAHAMAEKGGVLNLHIGDVTLKEGEMPEAEMQPGTYVQLTVRDTGTGIEKDIVHRIFEPFFTTKEAGQGTGMGLAVVYGIVKSHGGAITVMSEPGKGSTFTVFLIRAGTRPEEKQEEGADIPHGDEHILLVDDEPGVVQATANTLARLGYRVTTALNGSEAWRIFEKDRNNLDLVITDQTMPDLTGIDLARRIIEARKDLPVILFTGYSESVSPEMAHDAGIGEFVMKPIVKREAAETIRRVLDRRGKAG